MTKKKEEKKRKKGKDYEEKRKRKDILQILSFQNVVHIKRKRSFHYCQGLNLTSTQVNAIQTHLLKPISIPDVFMNTTENYDVISKG